MDEEDLRISGPGSEKRTRFFDFCGEHAFSRGLSSSRAEASVVMDLVCLAGCWRPVLLRRFRRTAMGLSSSIVSASQSVSCLAIVKLTVGVLDGEEGSVCLIMTRMKCVAPKQF